MVRIISDIERNLVEDFFLIPFLDLFSAMTSAVAICAQGSVIFREFREKIAGLGWARSSTR